MALFDKVLEFFHSITFPRAMGTVGDKKVQDLIRNGFSDITQGVMGEQEFTISKLYMAGVLNLIHPFIGAIIITNFLLISFGFYAIAFYLSITLLIVALFNRQIVWSLQFWIQQLGSQVPCRNIWLSFEPTNSQKQTLVLLAHYDSISHTLSPLLEALGYLTGFLGGVIFALHSLFYLTPILISVASPGTPWQLIWGVIVGGFACIELVNVKGNNSDGAIDNASAVAQCYHLALSIAEDPLKNTRVIIVATGAEEWGDYGAYYFVKGNPCELSPRNTRFIVIDGIGSSEKGKIIYGVGLPVRHWSNFLEGQARALLQENPATPLEMQAIPPLLQVASDHVPVDIEGYEFIWFASNSFFIHSSKDTTEMLNKENYQYICKFIEKYVRKLDEISTQLT